MLHLILTLPVLLAASRLPGPSTTGDEQAILAMGREHCELFYAGELDSLWERMTAELKSILGNDITGLETMHEQLWTQLGEQTELLREEVQELPDARIYSRRARFEKYSGLIDFVWRFSGEDTIAGVQISVAQAEAPSKHLEYQTKTPLRLPFEETWDVFWGGRSLAENYHTAYPDQRFAYDLLIFVDGATHRGEGQRNEDYYCFGKRLVAPGSGTVLAMADGVEDNAPGEMNPRQALGNHVILDHGNGEFSFMAHFKKGSLQVGVGDRVEAGQFLGLAGNSGNTSEPHLHYHLQNTPTFNQGEGLPSQFLRYRSNGEFVERGEPVKGQRIQPE